MPEFSPDLNNDFAKNLAEKAKDAMVFAEAAKSAKKSGLHGISEPGGQFYRINPCLIEVDTNWNSRDFTLPENLIHIENLASSIAAEGVKVPLTVAYKSGKVMLKDGECRLRAVWHAINNLGAEIGLVPVMSENRFDSEADSLIGQFVRNAGKPFTPLEAGKHFHRLLAFMPIEEIARRVGQSSSRVRQLLELWAAPEEIKAMVVANEVSSSQALSTLNACNGDATKAAATLKAGLLKAKAEGKDKLTAKHIEDPKTRGVTAKKIITDIFHNADIEENMETETVTIIIPFADWDAIKSVLKI